MFQMNITVICVGKIKEKFFTDAINEYKKRISRFAKCEIIEIKDEKIPEILFGTGNFQPGGTDCLGR